MTLNIQTLKSFEYKYNPFMFDRCFDITGIETYRHDVNIHLVDDVVEFFDCNVINIMYDDKSAVIAIGIFLLRITDSYFSFEKIIVDDRVFYFKNKIVKTSKYTDIHPLNSDDILKEIGIDFLIKNRKIKIVCASFDDFNYSKSVLMYTSNSVYESSFNLNKELDRWNHSQRMMLKSKNFFSRFFHKLKKRLFLK